MGGASQPSRVTDLQALNLRQAGEPPKGWIGHGPQQRPEYLQLVQVQAPSRALYDRYA